MRRDEKALDGIISRLSKVWQGQAREAVGRLYELLDGGRKVAEAIAVVRDEYPALFTLPNVRSALVEAAAYGYGVVPSVLSTAQVASWGAVLGRAWDGGGMKLSEKLHGADVKMREAIADTVRDQMRRNAVWTEAARALYDGYGRDHVVRTQQLPRYLSAVRYSSRGSVAAVRAARRAVANIERLSRCGAPTRSLKAAYGGLVQAAQVGTAEQLERACYVAIEEKSRYVAQRIIRTELARAYSDGFNAKIMQDDDVVAVRLRLSTRHPVFDICNLFAESDMYGLGKGVYPTDKMPPVPLHPYCMCRFEEVYAWEVDISKRRDKVKQAGDQWLEGLSDRQRREVLGIDGDKAWREGASWQKYLRNWRGLAKPETRLKEQSYIWGVGSPVCDSEYIKSEEYRKKFDKLSDNKALNQAVYKRCKAMVTHRSGSYFEDLCILTADKGILVGLTSGKIRNEVTYSKKLTEDMSKYGRNELISIHNHGTNLPPTGADLAVAGYRGYKFGVVACHNGRVFCYSTQKAKPFTSTNFDGTVAKYKDKPYNLSEDEAIIKTLKQYTIDYDIEWKELM